MAKINLQPIQLRDMTNGIIHEDIVSDFKARGTASVNESINLHFDVMGNAKLRPGITLLGNQIVSGTDILGLHQFLDEGTGTDDQLIAVNGTTVYHLSGSTWTSIRTGLTTGLKARFTNFLDRVMMVNGQDTTQGWNGAASGSFDTTNLVSAPSGNFISNFRSRAWIANTDANPSRAFYSTVSSSTGTITWSSTQFIDISRGDGEDITGLKRSPRALLVFKPDHMYRIFGINETDPDPQINVGTYSQESIVETKAGSIFHDWNNAAIHIYEGSRPREISRPIKPYLEGVTLANRNDVAGWKDTDNVYQSVGNVVLNSVTFTNVVFRYTISTEVWTIYSYPQQFLVGSTYDSGTTREPVVGDDDGNILTFNNGNTDNGVPITFSLVTRWHDLSGVLSYTDTIDKLAFLTRNGQGVGVQYQVNNPLGESDWKDIGQIETTPTHIFDTDITGNRVRFRLTGTSVGEPFIYEGIEILESFSELVVD